MFEKIIVVTKRTPLEELIARLGTRDQARFFLEQEAARFGGGEGAPNFAEYVAEDATYQAALEGIKAAIPRGIRSQFIDRSFLPTFTFGERELVITLGPDGLVVNTAKYLNNQPILAINPDPTRIEGVLTPFSLRRAINGGLTSALTGKQAVQEITMACATLADGQKLYAVNDLFIGQKTHASARYKLQWGEEIESQSSSGIIVSTGAGSTGWLRSVAVGATGVAAALGDLEVTSDPDAVAQSVRFSWEERSLRFSVREPWPSKSTSAGLLYGSITEGENLVITSQMPQNGVIFSDGTENDYLPFDSGAVARITVASDRRVHLIRS